MFEEGSPDRTTTKQVDLELVCMEGDGKTKGKDNRELTHQVPTVTRGPTEIRISLRKTFVSPGKDVSFP